jgi:signal transduction histidine kinase
MQLKRYLTIWHHWIEQIRQILWLRSLLDRLMTPPVTPTSAEYEAWRQRFLWSRLGLCLQLAFVIWLTFTAHDVLGLIFPLKDLENVPPVIRDLWIPIDLAMLGMLLACLVFYRMFSDRGNPAVLFLGLFWSVTLVPQVLATLRGIALPDVMTWSLALLTQATLIPVRWELHLISQVGLLSYFYGINTLLGLTIIPTLPGQPERSIYILTLIIYLFWVCFICDLGVYLYERLQRAEFEARRQAQLFMHAVSHDLRNPVTGVSLVLKNLLKKNSDTVTVPRSLLERMIDSSDRQLNLINSLLEVHSSDIRGLELHRQPIALNTLVEMVMSDLEPLLAESQAMLIDQVSPDLPYICGDRTQLWRVFCNLIANALHHNPPGIKITINATLTGDKASLSHAGQSFERIGRTKNREP